MAEAGRDSMTCGLLCLGTSPQTQGQRGTVWGCGLKNSMKYYYNMQVEMAWFVLTFKQTKYISKISTLWTAPPVDRSSYPPWVNSHDVCMSWETLLSPAFPQLEKLFLIICWRNKFLQSFQQCVFVSKCERFVSCEMLVIADLRWGKQNTTLPWCPDDSKLHFLSVFLTDIITMIQFLKTDWTEKDNWIELNEIQDRCKGNTTS